MNNQLVVTHAAQSAQKPNATAPYRLSSLEWPSNFSNPYLLHYWAVFTRENMNAHDQDYLYPRATSTELLPHILRYKSFNYIPL